MATTSFSGPLKVGPVREGAGVNTVAVVLSQSATVGFADTPDATSAFTTTIVLPAGSQMLSQLLTVSEVWSSAGVSAEIGTAADPDAFGDVADLTALGLTTVAPDATQAVAILDIGTSDLAVQATVTQTGVPTTGVATLTITSLSLINISEPTRLGCIQ